MRTGLMQRRIKLRKWQDVPAGGFGITPTYDAGVSLWASIQPVGAALFYGTQQVESGITHQVTVRRSTAFNELTVTSEHVIEHKNIRYRVKRAKNLLDEDVWLVLDVEQLGAIA